MGRWKERWSGTVDGVRAAMTGATRPRDVFFAVGIGVFVGSLPVYGLHILLCVALAKVLRLNTLLMTIACNISNPLFAPFLIALEIHIGKLLLDGRSEGIVLPTSTRALAEMLADGGHLLLACSIGSVPVGLALGAALGGLAALVARLWHGDATPTG